MRAHKKHLPCPSRLNFQPRHPSCHHPSVNGEDILTRKQAHGFKGKVNDLCKDCVAEALRRME